MKTVSKPASFSHCSLRCIAGGGLALLPFGAYPTYNNVLFLGLGTVACDADIQWLYQPGAITPTARYQKGQLHAMVTDHQGTPREIFTEKGIASWAGRLNT
ncbi:hypothetical protein WKS79_000451 [Providencia stuartii]